MSPDARAESWDWQDVKGDVWVRASIARGGGGYWPCMVNLDSELEGSIIADDARTLAAMLLKAADACDAATDEESA